MSVALTSGLEAYRAELIGYCYRMLSSAFEAEDAVQETLLRAWRGQHRFDERRSPLRSWLYSIATNVCIDMLRSSQRRARPMDLRPASMPGASLGPPLPETAFVQPIPDSRVLQATSDPAEFAVQRDTIRLAFVAALQNLPPRQRAVLIRRDVLCWSAAEVAQLLGTSVASANSVLQHARSALPSKTTFFMTVADATQVELRWYTKENSTPGCAVVYAHGGGMVAGDLDLYDEVVSWYVSETGVPFLSVKYRLAPEVHGTTLAEDVFAGLGWLIQHASELGVDPDRIAVMGDSGGGGPAAGAAILARASQIPLARQILVYPMLDDRNLVPGALPSDVLTWTYDNNFTGWSAVLGDRLGAATVSPIAAPARLADYANLAPAYVEVGDLDIFRDEDIAYAQRLAEAGVPVELHVHPGAPHGFDRFVPMSRLAQRALIDRARVVASL